ncbi:ATP-binding protein [Desulfosporosinus fructosivorans]|uniref:ATP-binding protein n=1 Tax=Desulfosporosinus fructosivorans TaxID=2018669 RepID=UPI001FB16510|nr:ATP-binding protein [Desulfosporosinus fructosivorans]
MITQSDIRELQMAKGAISAGVKVLMEFKRRTLKKSSWRFSSSEFRRAKEIAEVVEFVELSS